MNYSKQFTSETPQFEMFQFRFHFRWSHVKDVLSSAWNLSGDMVTRWHVVTTSESCTGHNEQTTAQDSRGDATIFIPAIR